MNAFLYDRLVDDVERRRRRGDARVLEAVEAVANFAWFAHPGRLADGALENVALERGHELPRGRPAASVAPATGGVRSRSRTLHVATEIYLTGGHSRVLAKWIQRDLGSSHAVVLTRQHEALPEYFERIAAHRSAPITVLRATDPVTERASRLRALSAGYDRVVLHHHPDDVVPVVAYAEASGPPVAMFNHAHFWFSLGSTVADCIVNTMRYFQRLTLRHRYPRTTDLLRGSLGLEPIRWTDLDKGRAKERVGLSPARPVVLSIGAEHYFAPVGGCDFFATLERILECRPDLQVLVVGVPPESAFVPASIRHDGRVRLVGPVADPKPYYEAADLCLESFPMPSLGAFVEAVAFGQAFPVPAYAAAESPLRVAHDTIAAAVVRPHSETEYVAHVCRLLEDPATSVAQVAALRRELVRQDERFGEQFAPLYERLGALDHRPRAIPVTPCSREPENHALASVTAPDVGDVIDHHLSLYPAAVAAHARAVGRGYEGPRDAAGRVASRVYRAVRARLR